MRDFLQVQEGFRGPQSEPTRAQSGGPRWKAKDQEGTRWTQQGLLFVMKTLNLLAR